LAFTKQDSYVQTLKSRLCFTQKNE